MATFPPSVTPAQGGAPQQGGGAPGAMPASAKLAYLAQAIQGLAKDFPQGQQGIKMMLDGLRQVQASASAQSAPQQNPAPPR